MKMKLLICMFGTIKLRGKNMKKIVSFVFWQDETWIDFEDIFRVVIVNFLYTNGHIDTPTKELVFRATKMAQRRHSEPLYSKSEGVLVTVLVLLQFA